MIKGQQIVSKMRNEMGDINKAGAGAKLLREMKRMFNRSRSAKFPKAKSARKDMGIGSSVQSFKPKKSERGSFKSAGVENDVEKSIQSLVARYGRGSLSYSKGAKYRKTMSALRDAMSRRALLSPRIMSNIGTKEGIKEMHRVARYLPSKSDLERVGFKRSIDVQLNDINKSLESNFARYLRGATSKLKTPAYRARMKTAGESLVRRVEGSKYSRELGGSIKRERNLKRLISRYGPKGYKKSIDTQINDLRKAYPNIGGLKAGGVRGKTTYPPMSSTELSQMHHASVKPSMRTSVDVGGGKAARYKASMARSSGTYRGKPSVSTSRSVAIGPEAYQTRRAAGRLGEMKASAASKAKWLGRAKTAGKIAGGAAAIGGGALLARHLMRRHAAKKAQRMAAQSVGADANMAVAQGIMGNLANLQKRIGKMKQSNERAHI